MGLFGDDKRQDDRLDSLESHVRIVTEAVRENQLDIATSQIALWTAFRRVIVMTPPVRMIVARM